MRNAEARKFGNHLAVLGRCRRSSLSHNPQLWTACGGSRCELRVSFEFRNLSWFTDEVYAILCRHEAVLCLAEWDEMAAAKTRTAGFAYLRLCKCPNR